MLRLTLRRFQGWGQAAGGAAAGGGGWGADASAGGGGGGWGQSNDQAAKGTADKTWGGGAAVDAGATGGWGADASAAAGGGWGQELAQAVGGTGGWGDIAAPVGADGGGGWGTQASSDAGGFEFRKLTPPMLLEVVKGEPGETHEYYAKMYFGPGTEGAVKHNLWGFLKKFGHVTMERMNPNEPPRWYPINFKAKPPKVKIYDSDEWDLSVLPEHQTKNPSKAAVIAEQRRLNGDSTTGPVGGGLPASNLAKSTWGGASGAVDPEWSASGSGSTSAGSWGAAAGGSAGGWGQDVSATPAAVAAPAGVDAGDRYGEAPPADDSQTATPAAVVQPVTPEPTAPVVELNLKEKIHKLVTENPSQPMHDYIDLLEKTDDKSQAPVVFRELRQSGSLARVSLVSGGFAWVPIAQQQY